MDKSLVALQRQPIRTEFEIMESWQGDFERPVVSICCITYNHGKFIHDAISSFLAQKTNFPIEIIIRDDASIDETKNIINAYQVQYPSIIKTILEVENQYSKGIRPFPVTFKKSVGTYVATCEGDDYWTDSLKLQRQFEYMEKNQHLSMCFHNSIIFDDTGWNRSKFFFKRMKSEYCTVDLIRDDWFIPTQSMFIKKRCLENVPSSFDRIYNGDLAIQLICSTYGPIGCLDSVMSVYRIHPNSISMGIGKDKVFLYNKIITLFDIFNEFSGGKFSTDICKRKGKLQKQLDMAKLRQDHVVLFCILHPIEPIKYLLRKVKILGL